MVDHSLRSDSRSLGEIVSLSEADLSQIPIEVLNLICASDLFDAEEVDAEACGRKLDEWADEVHHETQRSWHRFLDDPGDFENSAAYFRILVMITVLQRDLGCLYNSERVKDATFQDPFSVNPDFSDPRDLFIHGILFGPGGTCASMPVLYVAVGRRLGYPLKLVEAKGHLFCRWDDQHREHSPYERFNIEGSGIGFGMFLDNHYAVWPMQLTEKELEADWYLKSLTSRQELAVFLSLRGACLSDNERFAEALECFDWCRQLTSERRYERLLLNEQDRFNDILAKRESQLLEFNSYNRRAAAHEMATMRPALPPETVVTLPPGTPWPAGLPQTTPARYVAPDEADPDTLACLHQPVNPALQSHYERQQRIRESNQRAIASHDLQRTLYPPHYAGCNIPTS